MASSPNGSDNAAVLAQIATIKAASNAFTVTTVRGVQGGYVVTAQTQYQDKTTKNVVYTENAEGVATTAADATSMSLNFHNTGSFASVQSQI